MKYSNYNIEIPAGKTSGEITTTCPKCSHDRKKKNIKCLGVNLSKGVWNCNHCAWSGGLKTMKEETSYIKPTWKNNTDLSANLVKWFEGRGISQATLVAMKITESKEFMPQTQQEENTINFNYFRNGELVNVKYRDGAKNFKLHKGAELVFYNMDSMQDEVYITEGEIDCLSFIQAGYTSVISVPNGANLNKNNLAYIDNCIDLFEGKKIHIATDNDIAGRKLREELAERFGKERCDYVEFKDCKDANECLLKYGIQGIIDSKPIDFPLEGVFTIADFSDDIEDMYVNGLDKGADTKIPGFDLRIVKGYITTITGIPSHGKSDWLDNVCLHLRMNEGWNGAFYSPENKPTQLHFSKLARKLIGKHWEGPMRMSHTEMQLVKKYLDKKFWFVKPEKDFRLSTILAHVKMLKQKYGCDFFVIDAWNKLEHRGEMTTDYVGKSLDELAAFCELNHIHCFLVAHPTKMPKKENGSYDVPTLYNISGSSNFYNKTDNGVCVYRNFDTGKTSVYRQKVKFDHWGSDGYSEYTYDLASKRYFHEGVSDHSNWINRDERQIAMVPNYDFSSEQIFEQDGEIFNIPVKR